MRWPLIISITILCLSCDHRVKQQFSVLSPDGDLVVHFSNENSDLIYSATFRGKEILVSSKMGFEFNNMPPLSEGLEIVNYSEKSHDTIWEQPWGEERLIREHYNELVLDLEEQTDAPRKLRISFRVFDDGFGFRYVFPEQEHLNKFEITEERTEFNFTGNHKAWWIKAYQPERYEYLYRSTAINDIDSAAHTPLTMETEDGLYLSIHEADLTNYAAMSLMPNGSNGLISDLASWSDGVRVNAETPMATPWRTVIVAEGPGELITSRLTLNLNPPNVLGDVSWVRPMKYVGIWWGMHIGYWTFGQGENHGATTARAKQYIDFAAQHGFDEVLIEGWNVGWKSTPDWYLDDGRDISFTKSTPDYNLQEVQKYAKSKGLTLQIYHETMANAKNYLSQIDSAFALASSLGIRSAKIGQVGHKLDRQEWHHGQYGVNYYREVVKKAAEYKIAVNFHEPIKDTGERRTYPNMFTREGARGTEYDAWSGDGGNPPSHTCVIPFTRLLGGPMDYTPGIFELTIPHRQNNQVNTTLAKQLALYVVIYSPMQMAADLIEHYSDEPAFQFIKDVPVDWETTKVLHAQIEDFVIIARKDRNSEDWYLGAITDEEARHFNVALDFLDDEISYVAHIYRDDTHADYRSNPAAYVIVEQLVSVSDTLDIALAPGGGTAIRFIAQ